MTGIIESGSSNRPAIDGHEKFINVPRENLGVVGESSLVKNVAELPPRSVGAQQIEEALRVMEQINTGELFTQEIKDRGLLVMAMYETAMKNILDQELGGKDNLIFSHQSAIQRWNVKFTDEGRELNENAFNSVLADRATMTQELWAENMVQDFAAFAKLVEKASTLVNREKIKRVDLGVSRLDRGAKEVISNDSNLAIRKIESIERSFGTHPDSQKIKQELELLKLGLLGDVDDYQAHWKNVVVPKLEELKGVLYATAADDRQDEHTIYFLGRCRDGFKARLVTKILDEQDSSVDRAVKRRSLDSAFNLKKIDQILTDKAVVLKKGEDAQSISDLVDGVQQALQGMIEDDVTMMPGFGLGHSPLTTRALTEIATSGPDLPDTTNYTDTQLTSNENLFRMIGPEKVLDMADKMIRDGGFPGYRYDTDPISGKKVLVGPSGVLSNEDAVKANDIAVRRVLDEFRQQYKKNAVEDALSKGVVVSTRDVLDEELGIADKDSAYNNFEKPRSRLCKLWNKLTENKWSQRFVRYLVPLAQLSNTEFARTVAVGSVVPAVTVGTLGNAAELIEGIVHAGVAAIGGQQAEQSLTAAEAAAAEHISSVVQETTSAVLSGAQKLGELAAESRDQLAEKLGAVVEAVGSGVDADLDRVGQVKDQAISNIAEQAETAAATVNGVVDDMSGGDKMVEGAQLFVEGATEAKDAAMESVQDSANRALESVKATLTTKLEELAIQRDKLNAVMTGIDKSVQDAMNSGVNSVVELKAQMLTSIQKQAESLGLTQDNLNLVIEGAQGAWDGAMSKVEATKDAATNLPSQSTEVVEGATEAKDAAMESVQDSANRALESVTTAFNEFFRQIPDISIPEVGEIIRDVPELAREIDLMQDLLIDIDVDTAASINYEVTEDGGITIKPSIEGTSITIEPRLIPDVITNIQKLAHELALHPDYQWRAEMLNSSTLEMQYALDALRVNLTEDLSSFAKDAKRVMDAVKYALNLNSVKPPVDGQ